MLRQTDFSNTLLGLVVTTLAGPAQASLSYSGSLSSPTSDPPGWISKIFVGTNLASENPNMPADMYGIRFCSTVDPPTLVLGFDSDRNPVWGGFYARDRAFVFPTGMVTCMNDMYNAGFAVADPLVGPHNGSVMYHLLVPDSTAIPAPGAIVLGGLGVILVGRLRRRGVL